MAISSKFEPKEDCPSFYKVIRYPSAPHLKLPIAFVRNYLEKIPENPVVKTATGREHSWKLKLIKSDEDYYFCHGWDVLVKDAKLGIKDIVVFWLIDPNTFQVLFLDANGCEKDLTFKYEDDVDHNLDGDDVDHNLDGDDDNDDDEDDEDDDKDEKDLCFEKIISKKTHRYHLLLPKKFVRAAELENKRSIKLKNQQGNEWTLGITVERYASVKYFLSACWANFRRYNQLMDGDKCLFKFNKDEGVLHLYEVIKNKRPVVVNQENSIDKANENKRRRIFDGVKVKREYESGYEIEAENRNKGRVQTKQANGDGGATVKIEDESVPVNDKWVMSKRVVYF
ncbi:B3 domain-containing protein REM10-like isoform X2 [Rutidosis leptorrhynchoides]|uniref:B3 domain-containing protein REM10-like isoform X2 n=1 Tax=Rutidosis leptorrhynchoides TaxID=125765 RepID=UPI003A99D70C